uniref:Lipase_3 domain-containing protein n=1 Tax=Macrostomum lignano TaxID=282301 RepID=A0A1I8JMW3_9PLAT
RVTEADVNSQRNASAVPNLTETLFYMTLDAITCELINARRRSAFGVRLSSLLSTGLLLACLVRRLCSSVVAYSFGLPSTSLARLALTAFHLFKTRIFIVEGEYLDPLVLAGPSVLAPFCAGALLVLSPLVLAPCCWRLCVLAPLVLAPSGAGRLVLAASGVALLRAWRPFWCWRALGAGASGAGASGAGASVCWRLWCWRLVVLAALSAGALCCWRLWCWRLCCCASGAGASGAAPLGAGASGAGRLWLLAPWCWRLWLVRLWCWRLVWRLLVLALLVLAPLVLAPLAAGLCVLAPLVLDASGAGASGCWRLWCCAPFWCWCIIGPLTVPLQRLATKFDLKFKISATSWPPSCRVANLTGSSSTVACARSGHRHSAFELLPLDNRSNAGDIISFTIAVFTTEEAIISDMVRLCGCFCGCWPVDYSLDEEAEAHLIIRSGTSSTLLLTSGIPSSKRIGYNFLTSSDKDAFKRSMPPYCQHAHPNCWKERQATFRHHIGMELSPNAAKKLNLNNSLQTATESEGTMLSSLQMRIKPIQRQLELPCQKRQHDEEQTLVPSPSAYSATGLLPVIKVNPCRVAVKIRSEQKPAGGGSYQSRASQAVDLARDDINCQLCPPRRSAAAAAGRSSSSCSLMLDETPPPRNACACSDRRPSLGLPGGEVSRRRRLRGLRLRLRNARSGGGGRQLSLRCSVCGERFRCNTSARSSSLRQFGTAVVRQAPVSAALVLSGLLIGFGLWSMLHPAGRVGSTLSTPYCWARALCWLSVFVLYELWLLHRRYDFCVHSNATAGLGDASTALV